ncbi:hypothetical protein [Planctobacterium marinum]|uniref:Lipoprotein n=1 Tax=Planctobacterium marinum TaxID=1631968 RepID=A0AA48HXF8_9ALTE|nr:hypothetical protein MACH26_19060 [Planctobacterium marinum]
MKQPQNQQNSFNRASNAIVLASVLVLSACSSTSSTPTITELPVHRIDQQCRNQAQSVQQSASDTANGAQFNYAAELYLRCIPHGAMLDWSEADKQDGMQMMALATLNFVKGGQVKKAKTTLADMRSRFHGRDLYLSDFTSFTDTLTALIEGPKLSVSELAALNISRTVRDEIERQQYWLSH